MNMVQQHFRFFNADVSLNTIEFFLVIRLRFNCFVCEVGLNFIEIARPASSSTNNITLFSTGSSQFSIEIVSSPGENTCSSRTLKGCSQNFSQTFPRQIATNHYNAYMLAEHFRGQKISAKCT